jgi:hypothetical protein
MSLPGFTAEAALFRAEDRSHWVGGTVPMGSGGSPQGIVPQGIECDISIRCIDGVRYMTRDCPDGSGETIAIGTCARISSPQGVRALLRRPWWF